MSMSIFGINGINNYQENEITVCFVNSGFDKHYKKIARDFKCLKSFVIFCHFETKKITNLFEEIML